MLRHGRFLLATAQPGLALACFQRMVEVAPGDAHGWQGLLDALMETRRHAEGLDAAVQAASLHPGDVQVALRHAGFLLALGDHAGAERAAGRAIELDPSAEAGHLMQDRCAAPAGTPPRRDPARAGDAG